ncbi:hypothetical protein MUB24_22275 [Lederbergia sp. NSJ-179]|uniref:hypothetical protein n=1 Tax=Lederbergia sp. NSJ-179 TaxID=2931402 RepID=UPI001FD62B82|nr:hypothetical protein [Lederbergia sp. NSJ-179]MCJ7843550.1 hypothetical protein [Lederbergia sp. NSJ-179]
MTENFRTLSSTSENCLYIMNQSEGKIRLITDFGNMGGAEKYDELAKIIPYSDSIHAKPYYDAEGIPDEEEFRRCLNLLKQANYDGPIVIIYDGPGDMWEGIDRVRKIGKDYLASIGTINRGKPVHHSGVNDVPVALANSFFKWYMERNNEIRVE